MENENITSKTKSILAEAFDRESLVQGVRMVAMTAALFGTMAALSVLFGGKSQQG